MNTKTYNFVQDVKKKPPSPQVTVRYIGDENGFINLAMSNEHINGETSTRL